MGSDPDAVVDPNLKLNGADNVWVADASIFPDLISGNTNAACMMIGAKLAIALSQPAAVRAA
jgi:choline dehydrogenase